ncbi:hypothetical protein SMD11_1274 [Streptomyces albireticuli]|uniref:Uncharacterized protein n=1 Tax=Streptomyces albireticuli TaxID=1940 RepID=A0A1Z2KY00_9ACTN|nr:hypothetical protein SMD11_1274 [Streptomyces albireticuli]
MWVEYRTRYVRRWSRGKVIGVVYGEPKMKRDNITHLVIQDWYSADRGQQPHEITGPDIIPITDARKPRS